MTCDKNKFGKTLTFIDKAAADVTTYKSTNWLKLCKELLDQPKIQTLNSPKHTGLATLLEHVNLCNF